jgi:hypothetical protein
MEDAPELVEESSLIVVRSRARRGFPVEKEDLVDVRLLSDGEGDLLPNGAELIEELSLPNSEASRSNLKGTCNDTGSISTTIEEARQPGTRALLMTGFSTSGAFENRTVNKTRGSAKHSQTLFRFDLDFARFLADRPRR